MASKLLLLRNIKVIGLSLTDSASSDQSPYNVCYTMTDTYMAVYGPSEMHSVRATQFISRNVEQQTTSFAALQVSND